MRRGCSPRRSAIPIRSSIFEPKLVYRTARGEVPEGEYVVPLGQARIAREGTDVTLIAYGAMVDVCELAADAVDVVVRGRRHPLAAPARRGGDPRVGREDRPRRDRARGAAHRGLRRRARGADRRAAIFDLQGPVLRVTGYDVPYPYWTIEDAYMPSVERVVAAVRQLVA